MFDIKIVGGTVVDGTGAKGRRADLGIVGDQIAAIGDLSAAEAGKTIDASGKIVSPGFIDMHTHSDISLTVDPKASSKIYDGVTTEVIGNCGIGVAPICEARKGELLTYLGTRLVGTIPIKLELPWNTMEEYFSFFDSHPTAANISPLLAQGAVRINEMGFDKQNPTREQMARMKAEITKAFETGCVGLSSGLVYMPGEFTTKDELAELCTAAAPFGAPYVTHMRSEGEDLFEALEEALHIAKTGGVPLHISHLKVIPHPKVRGRQDELLARIDRARDEGLDVTFDAYPYASGCTSLGALVSPWAFEGGADKMLLRIQDPANRARIRSDIENGIPGWQNFAGTAGNWNKFTIATVNTGAAAPLVGKTIAQIADEQRKDPFDVMFDTLIQESGRVQVVVELMEENAVSTILSRPDCMIGSDGQSLSAQGILSHGRPHPRAFGTRARVLGHYSRDLGLFPVETAVRKMSALPAQRLGMDRRGTLKEGNFADVTVFDYAAVRDAATYSDPKQYSEGFQCVIVNGKVALEDGVETAVLSGRVLRGRV